MGGSTTNVAEREIWGSKFDFIVTCIGYAVGYGNVWRFPYLCYRNGGGAFLVPYFICLGVFGLPMLFLEITLGQLVQKGAISAWDIYPVLKGIGFASCTLSFGGAYNVVFAWTFFYLFSSFTTELPWGSCDGYWNNIYCNDPDLQTDLPKNSTLFMTTNHSLLPKSLGESPAEQFWERRVLNITDGIEDMGSLRWELVGCHVLSWFLIYICICFGIRISGKIVYFTAFAPYVILSILLVRGLTLPGAADGIYYFITPRWYILLSPTVWIDAATQIFFSIGLAFGCLISLGSYNKFRNNTLIDAVIVTIFNTGTSIFAGFAIFAVLGAMAKDLGVDVSEVVKQGPGLAFIAYPAAVAKMTGSTVWAILFFLMLLMLGIDSKFSSLEGFITSIIDEFPSFNLRKHRPIFVGAVCVVSFFVGIPNLTRGGVYLFQIFELYGLGGIPFLWIAAWECIALSYGYGIRRIYREISDMLGFSPGLIWPISWAILAPMIFVGIFIFSFFDYQPPRYGSDYFYPPWAELLGWFFSLLSMQWIVTYALYLFIKTPGSLAQRWKSVTTPRISLGYRVEISSVPIDEEKL